MKSTQIVRKTLLSAAVAAAALSAGKLSAVQIEEIIVTTQKREQSLQDVPISVSAFTGSFMEKAQISDAKQVASLTPGVSGDTDDSFLDSMNVRGISTNDFGVGAEPSIGLYQDGIYLGRTGGAVSSFFDIEMVEVVKGPQGTLFGRNASSGAISITTVKPKDEFGGSIDVGLGQDGYGEVTAMVNTPINDQFSSRLAVYHQQQDGWVTNINDGGQVGAVENTAARFTLAFENENITSSLTLEYEDRQAPPTIYQAFDPDETGLPFYSTDAAEDEFTSDVSSADLVDEGEVWGATLHVEVDLGNDYSLSSVTGLRGHNYYYLEDFDGSDNFLSNYNQIQEQDYFSQEFRINKESKSVSWFVGASWYKEDLKVRFNQTLDEDTFCSAYGTYYEYEGITDCATLYEYYEYDPIVGIGTRNDSVDVDAEYDGWGLYGDTTFHVSDDIDVTLGARYTEDNRDFAQNFGGEDRNAGWYTFPFFTSDFVSGSDQWTNTSVRAAMTYQLSDDVSTYLTYSTGYKAGGFNTMELSFDDTVTAEDLDGEDALDFDPSLASFDKEEVTNLELGLKGLFLDGQVQLNAALYSYAFDGMQSGYYVDGRYTVANVGDAEGTGLELDMRFLPSDSLDIYMGLAWADSELTKPNSTLSEDFCEADCTGAMLPGTVEFSAAMVATYTIPVKDGDINVTWEIFHQDESPGFGDFSLDPIMLDEFTLSNFRVGYESADNWTMTVWVNNVFDEFYYKGVAPADGIIAPHYFGFAEPRRAGIDVSYTF
ncbi:MAG: TonB-dependent receptor [Porticoccaceae bacterium]|jgi:iron complex outermembrane recepter protein|nr:TonB-dependent receptor [Porticoccaceae bacterium]